MKREREITSGPPTSCTIIPFTICFLVIVFSFPCFSSSSSSSRLCRLQNPPPLCYKFAVVPCASCCCCCMQLRDLILKASRSTCRRRRRRRRMGEEGKRVGICIRYSWQERECTCEGKLFGLHVFSLYRQFISNRTIFILCHPSIMRSVTVPTRASVSSGLVIIHISLNYYMKDFLDSLSTWKSCDGIGLPWLFMLLMSFYVRNFHDASL